MNPATNEYRVETTVARYLHALEADDLPTQEEIWAMAETDPELEACLLEALEDDGADQQAGTAATAPVRAGAGGQTRPGQSDYDMPVFRDPEHIIETNYAGYRCTVLVVDDEPLLVDMLARVLAPEKDFEVVTAASVRQAQEAFLARPIDILLTDLCLKGPAASDRSGIELIEWARGHSPGTVSLLMSGYGEREDMIEAINRAQVFHFIAKPIPSVGQLLQVMKLAARAYLAERKNRELLERLKDLNMELEDKVRRRTAQIREALQELQQKNRTLEKLALTDALTGLPNRRAMDNLAERELLWRKRSPAPLAIAFLDVDHFKNINTEYHWSGGDRVLMEVARWLRTSVRDIDYVGRYGGEEFMLIAPQADGRGAARLAERLRAQVEANSVLYRGSTIRVTVSVGVAVVDGPGRPSFSEMKQACEAALLRAKQEGRNRCVVVPVAAPAQEGTRRQAHGG